MGGWRESYLQSVNKRRLHRLHSGSPRVQPHVNTARNVQRVVTQNLTVKFGLDLKRRQVK